MVAVNKMLSVENIILNVIELLNGNVDLIIFCHELELSSTYESSGV